MNTGSGQPRASKMHHARHQNAPSAWGPLAAVAGLVGPLLTPEQAMIGVALVAGVVAWERWPKASAPVAAPEPEPKPRRRLVRIREHPPADRGQHQSPVVAAVRVASPPCPPPSPPPAVLAPAPPGGQEDVAAAVATAVATAVAGPMRSRYKGLHYLRRSGKWKAQLYIGKDPVTGKAVTKTLGQFSSELEAARAHDAGIRAHGLAGRRRLNLPEEAGS